MSGYTRATAYKIAGRAEGLLLEANVPGFKIKVEPSDIQLTYADLPVHTVRGRTFSPHRLDQFAFDLVKAAEHFVAVAAAKALCAPGVDVREPVPEGCLYAGVLLSSDGVSTFIHVPTENGTRPVRPVVWDVESVWRLMAQVRGEARKAAPAIDLFA